MFFLSPFFAEKQKLKKVPKPPFYWGPLTPMCNVYAGVKQGKREEGETMLELVTLDVKRMKKSNFLWAI